MGFLGKLVSAGVKTVLTPVAIVSDVANVAIGNEPNSTKELLESAGEDICDATDDLADGKIIGK